MREFLSLAKLTFAGLAFSAVLGTAAVTVSSEPAGAVGRLSTRLRRKGWRRASAPPRRASRGPRKHGEFNQPQRRRQSRRGSPLEHACGAVSGLKNAGSRV